MLHTRRGACKTVRRQHSERSGYSPIKASSNAPDEYVILDKISRFRHDYQMSSISKIVPRLGNITKIASRAPSLFVELRPRMRPWISSQPTAWVEGLCGSDRFIKTSSMILLGEMFFYAFAFVGTLVYYLSKER